MQTRKKRDGSIHHHYSIRFKEKGKVLYTGPTAFTKIGATIGLEQTQELLKPCSQKTA